MVCATLYLEAIGKGRLQDSTGEDLERNSGIRIARFSFGITGEIFFTDTSSFLALCTIGIRSLWVVGSEKKLIAVSMTWVHSLVFEISSYTVNFSYNEVASDTRVLEIYQIFVKHIFLTH